MLSVNINVSHFKVNFKNDIAVIVRVHGVAAKLIPCFNVYLFFILGQFDTRDNTICNVHTLYSEVKCNVMRYSSQPSNNSEETRSFRYNNLD